MEYLVVTCHSSSLYLELKINEDEYFKIRFSDHQQKYDADIQWISGGVIDERHAQKKFSEIVELIKSFKK